MTDESVASKTVAVDSFMAATENHPRRLRGFRKSHLILYKQACRLAWLAAIEFPVIPSIDWMVVCRLNPCLLSGSNADAAK